MMIIWLINLLENAIIVYSATLF